MRTLRFLTNCQNHTHGVNACHITQQYVTDLLSKQLAQYGFQTEILNKSENLIVSVENHPIALKVSCNLNDNGCITCEISAQADEEQVWFKKIETQSVIKQLAHAVENSLKQDDVFDQITWK